MGAALEWLEGRKNDRPVFLWVHLFDPHLPYDPPGDLASLFTSPDQDRQERKRALYEAEIHYTDIHWLQLPVALQLAYAR